MECNSENAIKMVSWKKKFFLKTFLISFILFVLSVVIVYFGHEKWATMAEGVYGLDSHGYSLALTLLMGGWKILIIQFTLVPFLALACIEKCLKKKAEND